MLLLISLISSLLAAPLLLVACAGHDDGWPEATPLPPNKNKSNSKSARNLSKSARNTHTDKTAGPAADTKTLKTTPDTKSVKSENQTKGTTK